MELLIFLRQKEISKPPGTENRVSCILRLFREEQLKWPPLLPDGGNGLGCVVRSGHLSDSRDVIAGSGE